MQLMNAFGERARHTIISGMPDQLGARKAIAAGIAAEFPTDAPPLTGRPALGRLFRLSRYMRRFDLVLTYNWGAFDAVMARYLFGGPPLVHHEDGFNQDEAGELKTIRNLYRRLGLSAAHRLVVPSRQLEAIARTVWNQPPDRLQRISNGIPVEAFAAGPAADAIPGLRNNGDQLVIGTVAGLRPVKNLVRLVRAFAAMENKESLLVIVGEGPDRDRIAGEAQALGLADRVLMPGFLPEPARYVGLFDIFALSSNSEQFPISLVEAMAAGLPVVATGVGDIASMVSDPNQPLIVEPSDEAGFAWALDRLAGDPELRRSLGSANRHKAAAEFDEKAMIARYAGLYGEAIGAPEAFMEPQG